MSREKRKVYIYTHVSTSMQIDGYSLDAQKSSMKAFCGFNDYVIAGEYEDAGKSGKTVEGRVAFNQMMENIKAGKDEVSFVLVFKLSRFGRNAADVLASLQVMQDFGVNLICVEDGIDSSKDAGKLMISVLSAVAEVIRTLVSNKKFSLYKTYDKIEEMEVSLVAAKAKKRSILSDKISGDNIYKALVFFDRMYDNMNEAERREFVEQLIEKVEVYDESQPKLHEAKISTNYI